VRVRGAVGRRFAWTSHEFAGTSEAVPQYGRHQAAKGQDSMHSTSVTDQDRAALAEFGRRVRAALGSNLVDLRLFGSKARGDAGPDSDIDVAVIVETPDDGVEDRVIDIAFDIDLAFDVYLSPRVIPRSVLHDPVWQLTAFVQAVQREGVPL
jgi:predicted nucleotidyltransferase